MGQGAKILLTNKTPYTWKKTFHESYQMAVWNSHFPETIAPGTSVYIYTEFEEGITITETDDNGTIEYTFEETGESFRILAGYKEEGDIRIFFKNLQTNQNAKGSTITIGSKRKKYFTQYEDLFVNFTLLKTDAGYVTIARDQDNPDWMKYIADDKNLAQLTIPGTHDSCTYTLQEDFLNNLSKEVLEGLGIGLAAFIPALSILIGAGAVTAEIIKNITMCQTMDISTQLYKGIRFLDIRLRKSKGDLYAFHGGIDLNLKFKDVLNATYDFLQKYPSETVIMSINKDGDGDDITDLVRSAIDTDYKMWYGIEKNKNENITSWEKFDIPNLKDARGKIVLLRRFGDNSTQMGINASTLIWPDNGTNPAPPAVNYNNLDFYIQDNYQPYFLSDLDSKFDDHVKKLIDASKTDNSNTLYINFASGTGGVYPQTLANGYMANFIGTNGKLFENYVPQDEQWSAKTTEKIGIIPMDFPETPYNGAVIGQLISINTFS